MRLSRQTIQPLLAAMEKTPTMPDVFGSFPGSSSWSLTVCVVAAAFTVGVNGCTRQVSFSADVFPILQERCIECHKPGGKGYEKSGFDVSNYESVMKGTNLGPVITAGSAVSSTLMRMVEHKTDPRIHMPFEQTPLTPEQIEVLSLWINQGARDN